MLEESLIGFNSPYHFAVYEDAVYLPTTNGVTITKRGGKSTFWRGDLSGAYEVHQIAICNATGCMCLTEKRLEVSLWLYDAATLEHLDEIPNVAAVEVADVAFSDSGDALFVLTNNPVSCVQIFHSQRGGSSFSLFSSVTLPLDLYRGVIPISTLAHPDADFAVFAESRFECYVLTASGDARGRARLSKSLEYSVEGSSTDGGSITSNTKISCCAVQGSQLWFATTTSRSFSAYNLEEGCVTTSLALSDLRHGVVVSICVVNDDVFVGTSSGALYRTDAAASDVTLVTTVPTPNTAIVRLLSTTAAAAGATASSSPASCRLYLGTCEGLYVAELTSGAADCAPPVCVKNNLYSDVLRVMSLPEHGGFAAVLRQCGVATCTERQKLRVWRDIVVPSADDAPPTPVTIIDAAMLDTAKGIVALVFSNRALCLFDCVNGVVVDTFMNQSDFAPTFCQSNGDGKLVCGDTNSLYFLSTTPADYDYDDADDDADGNRPSSRSSSTRLYSYGFVHNYLASSLSFIRFIPNEDSFLVVCRNAEVFLLMFPDPCAPDTEHSIDSIMENVWRLDFPVTDLFPCYVEGNTINLLVHSYDKDTKLYALERQKEGDSKVLRPLFLMRDHESGGGVLQPYTASTLFSGGKDGCLALRDFGNYQTRMSPIPPSKEKRKPLMVCTVRQFARGGVTTVCLMGSADDPLFVCGGADSVLTVVPAIGLDQGPFSWLEPAWTVTSVTASRGGVASSGARSTAPFSVDNAAAAAPTHAKVSSPDAVAAQAPIRQRLQALQSEWQAAMTKMDESVPVEALLLPKQQDDFTRECEEAVETMRNDEFYHGLLNEYLQHTLTKLCFDSMEVNRSKLVSIRTKGLEVHNFHIAKLTRANQPLARKMCFMRKLQRKASAGFSFTGLRSSDGFQVLPDVLGSDNAVAPGTATSDECRALASQLRDPLDIYTRCRGVAQATLLQGIVLALKDHFNRRYAELRARKESAVSNIKERSARCVKIAKQLGGPPQDYFVLVTDPEEDSSTLFTVKDEELDESVRALIPKSSESKVFSPSNEAALKLWMDGLEKDVERLEVDVPLPDFMDDTRDAFVPPDERTEEQVKRAEEYEKRLKEETEIIETRKEALRTEFKALQKENSAAAEALDKEFTDLRALRLTTQEQISESELQVANILRQLLKVPKIGEQISEVREHRRRLANDCALAEAAQEKQQLRVSRVQASLQALQDELEVYHEEVRQDAPFDDPDAGERLWRRFGKWKSKYAEHPGTTQVPNPEDAPTDDTPAELWEHYCEHCRYVENLVQAIATTAEEEQTETAALRARSSVLDSMRADVASCDEREAVLKATSLEQVMDVEALYRVYQGQVQNERAVLSSDFSDASLRWTGDVTERNALILSSSEEAVKLLQKTVQRQKSVKASRWETERLQYCVGTLEMELRQLHTLKVTRQMQEWLAGDAEVSEERELQNVHQRAAYVEENMKKKLHDLNAVARRLKSQVAERDTENEIIYAQSDQVRSAVEDAMTVKRMVDVHSADSVRKDNRAKEIYVVSELEETARCQQEELIRLKHEVDRLREATFPSFAVVSKRTV